MSITSHVTRAFPPSFISSGNGDPLAPQAVALAQRLRSLGVHIETLFFPADRVPPLPHQYRFNLDEPAGREALNRMLAFLKAVPQKDHQRPVVTRIAHQAANNALKESQFESERA